MKNIILLINFQLFIFSGFSQNYLNYYYAINKAKVLIADSNYTEAFKTYNNFIIENLNKELNKLRNSKIINIEILFRNDGKINQNQIIELCKKHTRIGRIFIYNSIEESNLKNSDIRAQVFFVRENIESHANCGVIAIKYFSTNIEMYNESQHYNTCLNRKICIDVNGEIKNCPSMSKSYGNIKETTIEEAINKQGFKDLWNVKKDDINVCKDCEFRHMCTDCRAFIKDSKNIYSQPLKCTYNPYIAKWEGEEGYESINNFINNQSFLL